MVGWLSWSFRGPTFPLQEQEEDPRCREVVCRLMMGDGCEWAGRRKNSQGWMGGWRWGWKGCVWCGDRGGRLAVWTVTCSCFRPEFLKVEIGTSFPLANSIQVGRRHGGSGLHVLRSGLLKKRRNNTGVSDVRGCKAKWKLLSPSLSFLFCGEAKLAMIVAKISRMETSSEVTQVYYSK